MGSRTYLGELEELVLLFVALGNKEAYGVSIVQELEKNAGRDITLSAVHAVLHRLEEKGFVKSQMGGASQERGGRKKRLFRITTSGKKAIGESRETRSLIWARLAKISPA